MTTSEEARRAAANAATDGAPGPGAGPGGVDRTAIEEAVRRILTAVGEDPDREGLLGTPDRVARMYTEILSGLHADPGHHLDVVFSEGHHEMVAVRDISFESMCEHHMMPFMGKAHVAYVPNGHIVGLSKIARVVEAFARRLQVQERLTSQVADLLMDKLQPQGVGVVLEATHTCMTMRGVKKPGSAMVTSAVRGTFKSCAETRNEWMSFLRA